jgi:hypothetical protein
VRNTGGNCPDGRQLFVAQQFGFAALHALDKVGHVGFDARHSCFQVAKSSHPGNPHGACDGKQFTLGAANRNFKLDDRTADGSRKGQAPGQPTGAAANSQQQKSPPQSF